MKTIIVIVAALLASRANAVTLTWIAPTQLTDSTPITAPITYNLYLVGATAWNVVVKGIVGLTVTPAGPFPTGHQCFAVTAVVNGIESVRSVSACLTISPAAPNPPTGVIAK